MIAVHVDDVWIDEAIARFQIGPKADVKTIQKLAKRYIDPLYVDSVAKLFVRQPTEIG
jgi:hypothetical protein